MIQQKLKEAVQIGALSVQYNSGDVKSRISMDAELKDRSFADVMIRNQLCDATTNIRKPTSDA